MKKIFFYLLLLSTIFVFADSLKAETVDRFPDFIFSAVPPFPSEKGTIFSLELPAAADNIIFTIYKDSKTIKTIQSGTGKTGKIEVSYDGKDENGNFLEQGDYTLKVKVFWKNMLTLEKKIGLRTDLPTVLFAFDAAKNIYGVSRTKPNESEAITLYYAPLYEKSIVLAEGISASGADPSVPDILNGCYGIAISPDTKYVYLANNLHASLQRVERYELKKDKTGFINSLGKLSGFTPALAHPWAMALSSDGTRLYVADQGWLTYEKKPCGQIYQFNPAMMEKGKPLITKLAGDYKLAETRDIRISENGDIYLLGYDPRFIAMLGTDEFSQQVHLYKFKADGSADETSPNPVLPGANRFCQDKFGNFYVSFPCVSEQDSWCGQLEKRNSKGDLVYQIKKVNDEYFQAYGTNEVKIGSDDRIYLLAQQNKIWVFETSSETQCPLKVTGNP